jgi:hypothetical protein
MTIEWSFGVIWRVLISESQLIIKGFWSKWVKIGSQLIPKGLFGVTFGHFLDILGYKLKKAL